MLTDLSNKKIIIMPLPIWLFTCSNWATWKKPHIKAERIPPLHNVQSAGALLQRRAVIGWGQDRRACSSRRVNTRVFALQRTRWEPAEKRHTLQDTGRGVKASILFFRVGWSFEFHWHQNLNYCTAGWQQAAENIQELPPLVNITETFPIDTVLR